MINIDRQKIIALADYAKQAYDLFTEEPILKGREKENYRENMIRYLSELDRQLGGLKTAEERLWDDDGKRKR